MSLAGAAVLVAAGAVGYFLGSLSPATVVARRAGTDLRTAGSGNPGASNAGRVLGRRFGVLVGLLDVGKGLVPTVLFGLAGSGAGLVAGVAAVLGHVSSPFLRGRGGKGVATAAGAVIGAQPLWAPVVLLTWIVVLAWSRWIALSSVCAAIALLVVALVTRPSASVVAWAAVLSLLVVTRHWGNLRRWYQKRRAPSSATGSSTAR